MPSIVENGETTYLENKRLDGGLLNTFVKSGGQSFKKKMVNGKLQVEFDSENQTPASSHPNNNPVVRQMIHKNTHLPEPKEPISFNNNLVQNQERPNFNGSRENKAEIRNKLYTNRHKKRPMADVKVQTEGYWGKLQNPQYTDTQNNSQVLRGTFDSDAFANARGYNQMLLGDNDAASNLILKPQFMRSHLDSNHTLRAGFPPRHMNRPLSVRSHRARTADTLNRRFVTNRHRPMHMYSRYQPSMSKYEHDLIRSQASLSKGNSVDKNYQAEGMVYGIPYGRYGTENLDLLRNPGYSRGRNPPHVKNGNFEQNGRGYERNPGMNNIYSFSNLRPKSQNQANRGSRRNMNNPIFQSKDPSATLRKGYVKYPSNVDNPPMPRHPHGLGQNNKYLYTNRPVSETRSHHEMSLSRGNEVSGIHRMVHLGMGKVTGRSNILAMFFRKILVFNSKLEGLKQKLFAQNSGFDCPKLFEDFARENPERMSMEDLMTFFRSLEFNYSPQIVYKILLYLTRKDPDSDDNAGRASNSKQFELTGSGRLMEVLKKRLNSMGRANPRFQKPEPSTSDLLDYSKFESFFSPLKETGTVLSDETIERSMQGVRNHENFLNKEALFHLIRQIVILSLRKLEDLGWVIRSLRLFPPEHLFQLLGAEYDTSRESLSKGKPDPYTNPTDFSGNYNEHQPNLTSVSKMDQNKDFFPTPKKMKNSLTFQNIPHEVQQKTPNSKEASPLLNRFLGREKAKSAGVLREGALHGFLKENGVDFLTGDLVFIFKELGTFGDRMSFEQFSAYLTGDLWSL